MEGKKARIEYLLSEQGRKASLLAGGDGKELQVIETEATPEIIRLANVDREGNITLSVGFRWSLDKRTMHDIPVEVTVTSSYSAPGYNVSTEHKRVFFDVPQTVEQLIAWEKQRLASLDGRREDIEKEKARLAAEYQEREAKAKAEREAREKALAEREAREAAERAARETEKAAWIEAHGSDYLQRAFRLGYDCQRRYVEERAQMELPGFVLDWEDKAYWKDRTCPSEEALAEVEQLIAAGFDAKCVWLTEPIYECDGEYDGRYDDWEPREAIIVDSYLGKYHLLKEL